MIREDRKKTYHHKDLKKALLEAAREELRQFGPSLVSLRRIARRAGVSHAAPYRHFRGKDGLLATLCWEGQAVFTDCLKQARETGEPAPQERLFRLGLAYLEFAGSQPEILELMFSETGMRVMHLQPPQDYKINEAQYDSFSVLETTVKECQAAGVLDASQDSGALAVLIWSFVHGYAVIRREGFADSMGASRGFSSDVTEQLVLNAFRSLILSSRRKK